ncbi:MAG TPA: rod shape-determining protein MreC [Candidatus Saccharimonadales bacterium]|nr:rod shape-determining protein MreC [Candidatus Saccharimonadales bacterium]
MKRRAGLLTRPGVNRRLFGLLGLGLLLIIANSLGWLAPVRNAIGAIGKPITTATIRAGGGFDNFFSLFTPISKLTAENQKLKAQVAALQQKISSDTELKAQNEALRRQLGAGTINPQQLAAAEVVGYQPDNFRQFITIAKGSNDGIQVGMAVVTSGTLVGTVQEVGPQTAKVFLVIDPSFRVAAIDQDQPDRPTGTIHGQIGSGLIFDKIAQNQTIKPSDTVITSGLGSGIPKGIIIGKVQTVDKRENGVFQSAQVSTDVPFSKLEIVYVVVRP